MVKEEVKLNEQELQDIVDGCTDIDYVVVDYDVERTDLEKGLEELSYLIKRKSDGKYFKFDANRTPYHNFVEDSSALGMRFPVIAKEVFPVQKTITVYE